MEEKVTLTSKVLVLDDDNVACERIREFFAAHQLTYVQSRRSNIMEVLGSNIDLGCIFLSENFDGEPGSGIAMARKMRDRRPELPIFLRRDATHLLDDLCEEDSALIHKAFSLHDMTGLPEAIQGCIFNMVYPNELIRGIMEITRSALESQIKRMDIEISPPYLVRDRLMFGEIFTLIPIESNWCRGYMMLQAQEFALDSVVQSAHTHLKPHSAGDFRSLNSVLSEVTNLIWGAFKNRFIAHDRPAIYVAQVPIVVNCEQRFISFGAENPQLCFKCTLKDPSGPRGPTLTIFQSFVFNLHWSPQDFAQNEVAAEDAVDSGEMEMF